MGELQRSLETSVVSVCTVGDLLIGHWYGPLDLASFRRYAEVQRAFAASQRRKYGVLSLIEVERVGRMDADAKAFSEDHLTAMQDRIGALAQVILGGGFTAATARAVVTGQNILKRPPYEWKIFDALEPSLAWMGSRVTAEPGAVRAAAEALLAR